MEGDNITTQLSDGRAWSGPEDTNQNEMNELALDNDHYGNDDDDDDDDDNDDG